MENLKEYYNRYYPPTEAMSIIRNITSILQDNDGLATVTSLQPSCVFLDYDINNKVEQYVIIHINNIRMMSLVSLDSLEVIKKFKQITLLEGNVYIHTKSITPYTTFEVFPMLRGYSFKIIERGIGYPVETLKNDDLSILPPFTIITDNHLHISNIILPEFLSIHYTDRQVYADIPIDNLREDIFIGLPHAKATYHIYTGLTYPITYPMTQSGFIGNYGTILLCLPDHTPIRYMRVRYRIRNNIIMIHRKKGKNILKRYRDIIKNSIIINSPLLRNSKEDIKLIFNKGKKTTIKRLPVLLKSVDTST